MDRVPLLPRLIPVAVCLVLACSGGQSAPTDGGTTGGGGGTAATGGGTGGGTAGAGGGGVAPTTGQLTITILGGAPETDVSLQGPDGGTRTVPATKTFDGLEPGAWVVRAKQVDERDAVAARVFVPDKTAQTVTVLAGQTQSVAVQYEADPTTGLIYLVSHVAPLPSVGPIRTFVRVFQASDFKTGGLKNPLHVAEFPDCMAGAVFLDPADRVWILCAGRMSGIEFRRFTRAQLGSETNPIPGARLAIANTRKVMVDRSRHVWSWDNGTTLVSKHPDTDFDVSGDAGFPVPTTGFTRTSPHEPRYFLKDGSLLGWDLPSRSLARYDAAALQGGGPVAAANVSVATLYLADGAFAKTDEAGLYVRFAQQLLEFPMSALQGDGGSVAPLKDFKFPDSQPQLLVIDAARRFWAYDPYRRLYVVVTSDQLAADGGVLTAAWEVSWPLADAKEQDAIMMLYPPPHAQRYAGY